jgi:hypothetical protein
VEPARWGKDADEEKGRIVCVFEKASSNPTSVFSILRSQLFPNNRLYYRKMVLVSPSADGGEVIPDGTKKKKLTNLEKGDGRRLVEYLLVVSSVPRESEEGAAEEKKEEINFSTSFDDDDVEVLHDFKPQITARYPLEDHDDNPLLENVIFFCHPSGSIRLKKENHMPKVRLDSANLKFLTTCGAILHLFFFLSTTTKLRFTIL